MKICLPLTGKHNSPGEIYSLSSDLYKLLSKAICTVDVATRPSSEAIPDLIFTTVSTNIRSISIDETFGSSDHSVITFLLDVCCTKKDNVNCSLKRDYSKADWDLLRTLLANVNWNADFCDGDIDKVWSKFKQKLAECIENSIPMKKRKTLAG